MPVTAKLSRRFYDQYGDETANELVEWFNSVDATYRSDLREMNELNFARFDAKLEQRLAEFELKIEGRLNTFELRIEGRLNAFEQRIEGRLNEFERKVEGRLNAFETRMAAWMFGGFVAQTGLLYVLLHAR